MHAGLAHKRQRSSICTRMSELFLHRLEFLEAANCNLLACTLAWHKDGSAWGSFSDLDAALLDAHNALENLRSPAAESAPAMQVTALNPKP